MKSTPLHWPVIMLTAIAIFAQIGCVNDQDTETNSAADGGELESVAHKKEPAPPAGYEFEMPVRIKAGDEFISVESPGYACPTLADVDGDGKPDLIVGQYNNGHMQFCKNIAIEGDAPLFDSAEWIKTGDEKATVPGVW